MNRRIRLGMVGGGTGSFVGAAHRVAARLDDEYEFVAGALSSDPDRALSSGRELRLAPDRCYADYREMARREAGRADGIDAVVIATPNHLHAAISSEFLRQNIHVICDKPLATSLADADALAALVERSGLLFMVTYTYTGYAAVRHARELVASGALGDIRVVQTEYAQDWLAEPIEAGGNKQAAWRTDPDKAGPAGALGDIGTHALQLAQFVTGLALNEISVELSTFVTGRRVDDHVQAMLRFEGGARGTLFASQVASGCLNRLQLHVYGSKAGLHFDHENPEALWITPLGEPARRVHRGAMPRDSEGQRTARLPAGHPEGYYEAFAQLYRDFATLWRAKQAGSDVDGARMEALRELIPGIRDGRQGVAFIDAALRSHRGNGAWTALPAALPVRNSSADSIGH